VPQIADSDDLDAAAIVKIIAATDYDAEPPPSPPSHPTQGPHTSAVIPASVAPSAKRWADRIRRKP
jgi:hypothetical protein